MFRILSVLVVVVFVAAATAPAVDIAKRQNAGNPCPGGTIVNCFADPCTVEECPLYPYAECVANYCGGCNAEFFYDGEKVDCNEKPGKCPNLKPPSDLTRVLCIHECDSDIQCDNELKCCSNGCASMCLQPIGVKPPKDCNGPEGHHEHGSSFPSDNGCNVCFCNDGRTMCTKRACTLI
ncbi:chelonianin-like [Saccoglossus kowalevskii]|uniref:WAP four-disulfide core domain protein 2-like n=1 Tax=Saccoglossus kowalevskii TaxID=10224 RepID=A0ABM0GQT1_SACKO|nr:PREDICTED: WAP four-disulfide core domain protein 2-like [Saccoglossus kowalevskii]